LTEGSHVILNCSYDLTFIPELNNIRVLKSIKNISTSLAESKLNIGNHKLNWSLITEETNLTESSFRSELNIENYKWIWSLVQNETKELSVNNDDVEISYLTEINFTSTKLRVKNINDLNVGTYKCRLVLNSNETLDFVEDLNESFEISVLGILTKQKN
jgi:hypothetical protein